MADSHMAGEFDGDQAALRGSVDTTTDTWEGNEQIVLLVALCCSFV